MKSLICVTALAGLLTVSSQAAKPIALFNGKNLAGWDGETNKLWRVENGEIVGGWLTEKLPRNEFLATVASYTNYVLRLKFKLVGTEGFVNSGVQFRSVRMPHDSEMIGYQADIGEGWFGCLYDESRRNKVLARPDDATVKAAVKLGQWNDYEIRCEGPRVVLKLNGIKTVDYTEDDPKIPLEGRIGLQVHGGGKTEVRFKDVRLEPLP